MHLFHFSPAITKENTGQTCSVHAAPKSTVQAHRPSPRSRNTILRSYGRLQRTVPCRSASADSNAGAGGAAQGEVAAPRVAVEGDVVTVHFTCKDEQGNVLESSRETGEPASFEIGAGEIFGNQLFQTFDEAVRGLEVGGTTVLKVGGGDWDRDLLFDVPRDHQEIQRLSERYKNVGGLAQGLVVELANGKPAVVLEINDDVVKLDANHMLAGKTLTFELELVKIEREA